MKYLFVIHNFIESFINRFNWNGLSRVIRTDLSSIVYPHIDVLWLLGLPSNFEVDDL